MITVEITLVIPVLAALFCWLSPRERLISWISVGMSALSTAVVFYTCAPVFIDGTVIDYGIWYVDGMSSFFMMITSAVALMVALYARGYLGFEREERILKTGSEKTFYVYLNLFVAVMLALYTVKSVGVMWILIELTTLVSTFLVGFYRDDKSTEASWKYLIICSVGITLALIGISLVYASTVGHVPDEGSALDWTVLMSAAASLDPTVLKIAMVFIIIGFGTKAGFAPMHTWLPDAHSQAPTPVSALLSATLLNCALYCILRFYPIFQTAIPGYASTLMLAFGFVSLFIAAMFIINATDVKRMLAYSSIEHVALITIGFGIGTELSIYTALFMVMAHSLTKPILFFCAGDVLQGYGTKDMRLVRGLNRTMPFTAFMLAAGTIAIVGMPPFAIFAGELSLLISMMDCGMWALVAITVVLIVIIFAGFVRNVFPMFTGTSSGQTHQLHGLARKAPFVILLVTVAVLGLFVPVELSSGLESIVHTVFGGCI